MKLVPTNIKELGTVRRPYTPNYKILCEFRDSKYECVELKDYTHKDAHSCSTSFLNSIKRYKMTNIMVLKRGERVFLIKVEP
jgi:hypothetical protein